MDIMVLIDKSGFVHRIYAFWVVSLNLGGPSDLLSKYYRFRWH